ncbi:MAG: hypothetical protein FWE20_10215 [Defluviitaleaceae bacterium]|nr:hypothetical protein [Defluviitaleaceae bacterium]
MKIIVTGNHLRVGSVKIIRRNILSMLREMLQDSLGYHTTDETLCS